MAQLDDRSASAPPSRPAPAARDIPAATQLLAIAWLRWRMFANGFRRQTSQGKIAGLVVSIILRIILWPIFALWIIGPAVGSGFLAWMAVSSHHPQLSLIHIWSTTTVTRAVRPGLSRVSC